MTDRPHAELPSLRWFREFLHSRFGINVEDRKEKNLRYKLQRRIDELDLRGLDQYKEYLAKNPDEVSKFLDEVSTNKTFFFRERKHWTFLEEKLLPYWLRRGEQISVWSVPCATGEEPYTAGLLLERVRELRDDFEYRILAADISRRVLRKGVRAVYDRDDIDEIREKRPELFDRFFEKTDDGNWRISERIRRRVVFREYNLKRERPLFDKTFDLILSRNIYIYFDRETTQQVVDQLTEALKPGGFLFIGHTETLHEIETSLDRVQSSIYRKTSS